MVRVYCRHGEVETVLTGCQEFGTNGRFRGRLVEQISRITLMVIVMFPVCVVRITLSYMYNLSG
jgi:hypothetical protein